MRGYQELNMVLDTNIQTITNYQDRIATLDENIANSVPGDQTDEWQKGLDKLRVQLEYVQKRTGDLNKDMDLLGTSISNLQKFRSAIYELNDALKSSAIQDYTQSAAGLKSYFDSMENMIGGSGTYASVVTTPEQQRRAAEIGIDLGSTSTAMEIESAELWRKLSGRDGTLSSEETIRTTQQIAELPAKYRALDYEKKQTKENEATKASLAPYTTLFGKLETIIRSGYLGKEQEGEARELQDKIAAALADARTMIPKEEKMQEVQQAYERKEITSGAYESYMKQLSSGPDMVYRGVTQGLRDALKMYDSTLAEEINRVMEKLGVHKLDAVSVYSPIVNAIKENVDKILVAMGEPTRGEKATVKYGRGFEGMTKYREGIKESVYGSGTMKGMAPSVFTGAMGPQGEDFSEERFQEIIKKIYTRNPAGSLMTDSTLNEEGSISTKKIRDRVARWTGKSVVEDSRSVMDKYKVKSTPYLSEETEVSKGSSKLETLLTKLTDNLKYIMTYPNEEPVNKASGGRIFGEGGPREDKVPAYLSPGEFVVKASSAQRIGYDALSHMNKKGSVPSFGDGGKLTKQHISGARSYFNDEDSSLPDVFNPKSKLFNRRVSKQYLKYYKETLPQEVQEREDVQAIKSLKGLYNTLLDVSDEGNYAQDNLFLNDYSLLFEKLQDSKKPVLTRWTEKNLKANKNNATRGARGITGINTEDILKEKDGGLIKGFADGGTPDESLLAKLIRRYKEWLASKQPKDSKDVFSMENTKNTINDRFKALDAVSERDGGLIRGFADGGEADESLLAKLIRRYKEWLASKQPKDSKDVFSMENTKNTINDRFKALDAVSERDGGLIKGFADGGANKDDLTLWEKLTGKQFQRNIDSWKDKKRPSGMGKYNISKSDKQSEEQDSSMWQWFKERVIGTETTGEAFQKSINRNWPEKAKKNKYAPGGIVEDPLYSEKYYLPGSKSSVDEGAYNNYVYNKNLYEASRIPKDRLKELIDVDMAKRQRLSSDYYSPERILEIERLSKLNKQRSIDEAVLMNSIIGQQDTFGGSGWLESFKKNMPEVTNKKVRSFVGDASGTAQVSEEDYKKHISNTAGIKEFNNQGNSSSVIPISGGISEGVRSFIGNASGISEVGEEEVGKYLTNPALIGGFGSAGPADEDSGVMWGHDTAKGVQQRIIDSKIQKNKDMEPIRRKRALDFYSKLDALDKASKSPVDFSSGYFNKRTGTRSVDVPYTSEGKTVSRGKQRLDSYRAYDASYKPNYVKGKTPETIKPGASTMPSNDELTNFRKRLPITTSPEILMMHERGRNIQAHMDLLNKSGEAERGKGETASVWEQQQKALFKTKQILDVAQNKGNIFTDPSLNKRTLEYKENYPVVDDYGTRKPGLFGHYAFNREYVDDSHLRAIKEAAVKALIATQSNDAKGTRLDRVGRALPIPVGFKKGLADGGSLPVYHNGGTVAKTGAIFAEKGEEIIPKRLADGSNYDLRGQASDKAGPASKSLNNSVTVTVDGSALLEKLKALTLGVSKDPLIIDTRNLEEIELRVEAKELVVKETKLELATDTVSLDIGNASSDLADAVSTAISSAPPLTVEDKVLGVDTTEVTLNVGDAESRLANAISSAIDQATVNVKTTPGPSDAGSAAFDLVEKFKDQFVTATVKIEDKVTELEGRLEGSGNQQVLNNKIEILTQDVGSVKSSMDSLDNKVASYINRANIEIADAKRIGQEARNFSGIG